jgi:formylglycine-generating enzyme required for sulfatase activity
MMAHGRDRRLARNSELVLVLIAVSLSGCGEPRTQAQNTPRDAPQGGDASSGPAQAAPPELHKLLETFVAEFVTITPGTPSFPQTFVMGSPARPEEQPVHEVTLAGPFAIARYEVPQNVYEAVMGQNPSRWVGPRNSVEMITWKEADEFCRRMTALLQERQLIAADEVVRLPTEAEWEYCCRAGTTTAYSFGDAAQGPDDTDPIATRLDQYGWHTGNAAGNDPPVGALAPNPWGLFDIHGYLWEFCLDDWHETFLGAPADGTARAASTPQPAKVIRGGSWKDTHVDLRSSSRRRHETQARDDAVGFRCVRSRVASRLP